MASKTLNKFIDLYTSMNEGKITYEEFLDLSDPKNPDGIYKNVLDEINKAIGSKEFTNIDDVSRTKILDVRTNILTKGDDPEMIGIKDNFGLDPSTLATHRLLLKQGLKPVLDLTEKESKEDIEHESKEDIMGIPYTFASDQELAGKNSNEYFSFRVYNERGVPSEFTAKGTKQVDSTDPEAQKYIYSIFQYGNILIDKSDPEALAVEGLNGNGSRADINKGVIDLYPQALKPVIEDMQKAIRDLKTVYSQASISAGDPWTPNEDKQFNQWAYENLRAGKEMKDLETQIYNSPQVRIDKSSFANINRQHDIVPVEVPSEPLTTGFIKIKEVPSVAKQIVNMGSDYFIFIIIFGFFLGAVILLNYKYIGNKLSRRR